MLVSLRLVPRPPLTTLHQGWLVLHQALVQTLHQTTRPPTRDTPYTDQILATVQMLLLLGLLGLTSLAADTAASALVAATWSRQALLRPLPLLPHPRQTNCHLQEEHLPSHLATPSLASTRIAQAALLLSALRLPCLQHTATTA